MNPLANPIEKGSTKKQGYFVRRIKYFADIHLMYTFGKKNKIIIGSVPIVFLFIINSLAINHNEILILQNSIFYGD